MFCSNCGKNITDQNVCPFCGFPVSSPDLADAVDDSAQPLQEAAAETIAEPSAPYQNYAYPEEPYPAEAYQNTPAQDSPFPGYADAYAEPAAAQDYSAPIPQAYDGGAYPREFNFDQQPVADAAPAPKKKKKGLIIGIISSAVLLLAGAGVAVYFLVLAPLFSYNKAVGLKEDGKYQEAIQAFTDLKDYKDSEAQITECRYLEAKQLLTDGQYDDAIAAFKDLGDYEDSATQIKQCDYDRAKKLFDDGKYEEAKQYFTSLGDFSDSAEQAAECDYAAAKDLVESDPYEAVSRLEEMGDYKDSKDLIKQAKMNYCLENKNNKDTTTYSYLKELKAAYYPSAAELYDELYTYRVTDVFWNTDSNNYDTSSGVTKLSTKDKQVLHFTLEGGTPDDTGMQIQYTVLWPSGNKNDGHYDTRYHRYSLTMTNSTAGTLKVQIYTQDKKLLYTASVTVE